MRYQCLTNNNRVVTLTFKTGDQTVMTTTREYDSNSQLKRAASATVSSAPGCSESHTCAVGLRRTQAAALRGLTRWDYGCDSHGQAASAKKRRDDGSLVAGQPFEHAFESIASRPATTAGGDLSGIAASPRTGIPIRVCGEYTSHPIHQ